MTQLGPLIASSWDKNPRFLAFWLVKYKFAAKMLAGCQRVLEVGCGDGTGLRIVKQVIPHVEGIDTDWELLKGNRTGGWDYTLSNHNIMDRPFKSNWDGVLAIDVLEHILPGDEELFLENITGSMTDDGVAVFGSPSLEGRAYTKGDPHGDCPYHGSIHSTPVINCKTEEGMRATLKRHFANVFMFGMNDEIVGTNFGSMAHYRLAVCAGPR